MEMRVLMFEGEAYCDSDRQDQLVRRTLEAMSVDRGAAMFLVSGDSAAIRRLWSIVDASGLESAWEAFGARLDWQNFEMSS